jgi:hypothetical protein
MMHTADSPFVGAGSNLDTWREGGMGKQKRSCSYCGSMHPDDFMDAVRTSLKIGPTDKPYKLYVDGYNGKFYLQHLSDEQQKEFYQLVLDKKVAWGYPGYPYSRLLLPAVLRAAQDGG